MRQGSLVLLAALAFAMVACSGSDDAATTTTDRRPSHHRGDSAGHDRNRNGSGHDGVGDQ